MTSSPGTLGWRLCCAAAILLSVITFTPLVMPPGVSEPELFGLPRTLWASLAVMLGFVLVIFAGTLFHPDRKSEES